MLHVALHTSASPDRRSATGVGLTGNHASQSSHRANRASFGSASSGTFAVASATAEVTPMKLRRLVVVRGGSTSTRTGGMAPDYTPAALEATREVATHRRTCCQRDSTANQRFEPHTRGHDVKICSRVDQQELHATRVRAALCGARHGHAGVGRTAAAEKPVAAIACECGSTTAAWQFTVTVEKSS